MIAVVYVLSTIPTPLYVVYQEKFHFSHITLTLIYAAYVVGTVAAMFFLGRVSDQIGRRTVVLASLAIAAVSAVVFLLASGTLLRFGCFLTGRQAARGTLPIHLSSDQ